jgi:Ca-activated chloride channel family protein
MLMVRASCLVALSLVAALVAGCSGQNAPPASTVPVPGESKTDKEVHLGDGRYEAVADGGPLTAPMATPLAGQAGGEDFRRFAGDEPGRGRPPQNGMGPGLGGDKYSLFEESRFLSVKDSPLSTFSIDVDTASYSKARAYLLEHHALPPPDAVRIEELVNYFEYSYAGPTGEHPFAVHIETAECPWQPAHRIVRFGIQGKRIDRERPVSNLVFLIDVSGSMNAPNKLPLVQRGLSMLVRQLGENDRVAIVVYAGAAGLVLPSTCGADQPAILAAIEKLRAGGSTNGGQGIQLAYQIARNQFIQGGVNRVLLCTDGDFNVGVTSTSDLVRLAHEKAQDNIYLSILGFGFGNHNDALLEQLADKANGNYAFIDSDREANKVLVEQMQGTLVTIAKDVKLQVEFNPAQVAAYRLVGYENRRLADRDFNDDTKDAGDIGAGHSVTVLYEIVPIGADSAAGLAEVDPLKYQGPRAKDQEPKEPQLAADIASELLTLKLRYQSPTGGTSTLLTFPVKDSGAKFGSASPDLQFAASVASFGMLLRNSKHKGNASFAAVLETAGATIGPDKHGLRTEFLELIKAAQRLSGEKVGTLPPFYLPTGLRRGTADLLLKPESGFEMGLFVGAFAILGMLALGRLLAACFPRAISFLQDRKYKLSPGYSK